MDTKRYTTKEGECLFCKNCIEHSNCEAECNAINICIKKLSAYETAEEEGRLVVLPCDTVYFIYVNKNGRAHVRAKSILDLYLHEILGIDRDGRYWSAREEAEKALKKMEGKHE